MKRVVITGMGAVTPIGNTLAAYWQALLAGKVGIDFITKFDSKGFKVNIAAEVKDFDPSFYMEKNDIRRTDLYSQYALAAAAQAMEDSGIMGRVKPERLGVYVGSGIGGMDTFMSGHEKLLSDGPRRISPFFIPMMISNMATGNISIKYQAMGPTLPVVTACATSTHTLGEAFRTIKHGYADAIIAGGTEAPINALATAGFINCQALSTKNLPLESSTPFDKNRDGFVMGEGAAILVLEEYEQAKARGAKIYAEIKGYGNTSDAYHITAPHPEAEGAANAIRQALAEAGYREGMQVYYNAHGTSTPLNDKAETLAIKKAFGETAAKSLHISSTKSMTGHMLGAAGAAEAIAAVKALHEGVIPPTMGYKEADPDCDLNYTPNQKAAVACDFALSTSLGFGGHNSVVAFVPAE